MKPKHFLPIIYSVLILILFSGLVIIYIISHLKLKPIDADIGSKFITYSGTHFVFNSKPFYVGGTNNHYIAWASNNEVNNVLNDASSMHLNVVRTFISSVRGSINDNSNPTIWNWNTNGGPNNLGMEGTYFQYWDTKTNSQAFNDGATGLQHIDYLLSKAKSLNIKVLLSFNDFHAYTGGMQQMANWYGIRNVTGYKDDYHNVLSDIRVRQDYKNWISHILNHVNIYTGVMYKDDTTIFGWDLANEPIGDSKTLLQGWITEMAKYVKSIDHNHLLASGDEGYFNLSGDDPQGELANPYLDFGTMHTYPSFTKLSAQQTSDLIQSHCNLAEIAKKPTLLEEFGYNYQAQNPNQASVYKLILDNLVKNSNCAGFTFWRLTSHEDNNINYPKQNSEGFDINYSNQLTNTEGSIVLSNAAVSIQVKNSSSSSSNITSSSTSSLISSSSSSSSSDSSSINGVFVMGINLGGDSINISGNNWLSYLNAKQIGMKTNTVLVDNVSLNPNNVLDPQTTQMLKSLLTINYASSKVSLSIPLSSGNYQFYIWFYEPYLSYSRSFNLDINFQNAETNLGNLKLGDFKRYGPYNATVSNYLDIDLKAIKSVPLISGIEIYKR